ncbi:hypothetical protein FV196_02895 [Rothia dentocariosa]|jgi:hypothetical protein|uniref:hypothetical protein n=1 Tax=Rothia dentocariosa TaxID=2047 RepID=UPI001455306C|nr:hypothetical protein [Rothia dentocariosa]NLR25040.1 hypothetical protein [Rothia dentocariosa]
MAELGDLKNHRLETGSSFTSDLEIITGNVAAEVARRKISDDAIRGWLGLKKNASVKARFNGKPAFQIAELQRIAMHMGISSELFYQGVGQWSKEGK